MDEDRIPLPRLPRELHVLTGAQAPTYRTLYTMVLDGALRAEQHNGRWYVAEDQLPDIARALGLEVPDGPRPRRRAA